MRTCSTCSGLTPARSSAALMAKPPSSAALNGAGAPLILPIGVRAPATMYEQAITCPLNVHAVPATPCAVKRRTAHAGGDKRGQDGGDNLGRAAEMNVGAMASERDRASASVRGRLVPGTPGGRPASPARLARAFPNAWVRGRLAPS